MDKHHTNSPFLNSNSKGNSHLTVLQNIFLFLTNNVATASMVAEATGIKRKNICRYKCDLERGGKLWEIEKKAWMATGFKAWYLSTNPELAPINYTLLKLRGGTSL